MPQDVPAGHVQETVCVGLELHGFWTGPQDTGVAMPIALALINTPKRRGVNSVFIFAFICLSCF